MADTAAPAAPAPAASESAAPVVPPLVVSFRPSMVDKAVQAKSRVALAVSSQVSQSMEQGRATFRPPSSLQGRPAFKHDAEDVAEHIRELKQQLAKANAERDSHKAKMQRLEAKGKGKDRLVAQVLADRAHDLPKRLTDLIKECLSADNADAANKVKELESQVRSRDSEILSLRRGAGTGPTDASFGRRTFNSSQESDRSLLLGGSTVGASPDWGGDSPPSSPTSRSKSSATKRKSLSETASGKGKGDSAELISLQAELQRLQRLVSAGETLREGLERKVSTLEAENQQLRGEGQGEEEGGAVTDARASGGGAAAAKKKGEESAGALFLEDGREFENYIRRLAGIKELPTAGGEMKMGGKQVRVESSPKAVTDAQRAALAGEGLAKRRANRQMVMYEVAITSAGSGPRSTAECFVTLRGELGEYGPCALELVPTASVAGKEVCDVIALDVGKLTAIVIGHGGEGSSPAWHVQTVTIRRARTATEEAKSYDFFFDEYIAADRGSKALHVQLFPTAKSGRGPKNDGSRSARGEASTPRSGGEIDREAAGRASRSTVQAVLEMHVPEKVADAHSLGFGAIARALAMPPGAIGVPKLCRNLTVLLLGPRHVATQFVEWYGGCKMTNAALGTEACFTLVRSAPAPRLVQGQQALAAAGHVADVATSVPAMQDRFCVEEVVASEMRFAQVDFIHPPIIEGMPKGGSRKLRGVVQVLEEVKGMFASRLDSLRSIFKEIDINGDGSMDAEEFCTAMTKLGVEMSPAKANRIMAVLDVSGDGKIEYEEFLAAFRAARTTFEYDLDDAMEHAAASADLVIALIDPKSMHYNARELQMYEMVYTNHREKFRPFCFVQPEMLGQRKTVGPLLVAARARLEQVMELEPNSLPELEVVGLAGEGSKSGDKMDMILLAVAESLLVVEHGCVDQAHDNIRSIIDALWGARDPSAAQGAKARLLEWLKLWEEATAKRKHPPLARLHQVCESASKDVRRGHVVADDIEGWTPAKVNSWLQERNPALSAYASAIVDEKISGKRLLALTDESLRRRLGVQSLGHRREMLRHTAALLEGRKNFLKK